MMAPSFHLCAFRGSVTNGTTNTAIAGVPDQILTRDAASNFQAPAGATVRYAATGGTNIARSRINTPVLREVALPYIAAVNNALTIPSPANLADYGPIGFSPRQADSISVESTHTDAAPQVMYALMWLQFGIQPERPGVTYRTRFTSTITASAGTWQSGGITLDQVLPGGVYQITGMDVFGTNLLAARLIFAGGGWRPGIMCRNAVASIPRVEFTSGQLGAFGEFLSTAPPQLEIYTEAANTAQEGYLDLVKVANVAA